MHSFSTCYIKGTLIEICIKQNMLAHRIRCDPCLGRILDDLGNIVKRKGQLISIGCIKILIRKRTEPRLNGFITHPTIRSKGNRVQGCLLLNRVGYCWDIFIIIRCGMIAAAPLPFNLTCTAGIFLHMERGNAIGQHNHIHTADTRKFIVLQQVTGQHQTRFNICTTLIVINAHFTINGIYDIFRNQIISTIGICPGKNRIGIAAKSNQ